jgi:hypothetical protein
MNSTSSNVLPPDADALAFFAQMAQETLQKKPIPGDQCDAKQRQEAQKYLELYQNQHADDEENEVPETLWEMYKTLYGEKTLDGIPDPTAHIFEHIRNLIQIANTVVDKNSQPFYGKMSNISLLWGAIQDDIEWGTVFSKEQLEINDSAKEFLNNSLEKSSHNL